MDCDLQDPPEVIPQLFAEALKGNAIVYARRKSQHQSAFRMMANRAYFRTLGWIAGRRFDGELGSLSIISRPVIDAFLRFKERDRHYLMILTWLGFRSSTIEYVRDERVVGSSGYSFRRLLALALSGLFFSTTRILHWVIYLGLGLASSGILLSLAYVVRYFVANVAPGWTSLIVVQLVIGGIIIISIGMAALYIGKIFEAVQERPLYLVEEDLDGAEIAASQPQEAAKVRVP
jgi:dolichol-phosphate mannosyltransferase